MEVHHCTDITTMQWYLMSEYIIYIPRSLHMGVAFLASRAVRRSVELHRRSFFHTHPIRWNMEYTRTEIVSYTIRMVGNLSLLHSKCYYIIIIIHAKWITVPLKLELTFSCTEHKTVLRQPGLRKVPVMIQTSRSQPPVCLYWEWSESTPHTQACTVVCCCQRRTHHCIQCSALPPLNHQTHWFQYAVVDFLHLTINRECTI